MGNRSGFSRSQTRQEEWKPPKIDQNKGQRPMNKKIEFNMEQYLKKKKELHPDSKHFNLFWKSWGIERTKSSPAILINTNKDKHKQSDEKKTQATPRPHSARYSRHYLSKNRQNSYSFDCSTISSVVTQKRTEVVLKEEMNFYDMQILVHGYIRLNCEKLSVLQGIIKIIFSKCEVLETFGGHKRQIKSFAAGTMTAYCSNDYHHIECFEGTNGYSYGIHYLTIKYQQSGCTSEFGITTKSKQLLQYEDTFPEILKAKDVKEYKVSREHGVFTIKMDLEKWIVTFYKDLKELKREAIKPNVSYWFYVYYCLRSSNFFTIVPTDVKSLKNKVHK